MISTAMWTFSDLHPELVTADRSDVADGGLREKGIKTICYVSVGTLEQGTSPRTVLTPFQRRSSATPTSDWPDEDGFSTSAA